MRRLDEIEGAIRDLTPEEMAVFRQWFAEFDAEVWDRQLERDAAPGRASGGRLDALADEAINDARQGRCTDR